MLELKTLRKHSLNNNQYGSGPVIYWMQRDQRVHDNWALHYALEQARSAGQPCLVVFCLQDNFLGATDESVHYAFMWQGLDQIRRDLDSLGIPWIILKGKPQQMLVKFARLCQAGLIATDFSPLRLIREWKAETAELLHCRLDEIDAHNIVPCRVASIKQEYSARTFRPKIHRVLHEWLNEYPELPAPQSWLKCDKKKSGSLLSNNPEINEELKKYLSMTSQLHSDARQNFSLQWSGEKQPRGGSIAGRSMLNDFIELKLSKYDQRNDPNRDVVSGLSPYLHYGHLSAQSAALAVSEVASDNPALGVQAEAFLEELIVRRELSDNYCFYNSHYDSRTGWPEWAKKTLDKHRHDLRMNRYNKEQLEQGQTHDPLWNATQKNLVKTGLMPGYLRMYWAKKILEWSPDPETAQAVAIEFNDRYMLDGRDPNGYTGIAWSVAGVHDRPWAERPVFGMIRYMSLSGCRRKFDVDLWIRNCCPEL